ncbi:MAG: response regulator [bacterium]
MSKSPGTLEIQIENLSRVAPFLLVVDPGMVVTAASESVTSRIVEVVGQPVADILAQRDEQAELAEDSIPTALPAEFRTELGQPQKYVLKLEDWQLPLNGSWLPLAGGYLFLGFPDAQKIEDLDDYLFTDLVFGEHLIELLLARETNRRSRQEVNEASAALKEKDFEIEHARQDLETRLQELQTLQELSASPDGPVGDDPVRDEAGASASGQQQKLQSAQRALRNAYLKLMEFNQKLKIVTHDAQELALQAEQASLNKSDFLANMSHEIRTPINGLMGMIDLLRDTELTSEQTHYLDSAHSCCRSLRGIIDGVLDLAKIEAGKFSLDAVEFSPRTGIDELNDILAISAHGKQLKYTCDIIETVPAGLVGDPGRFRQILTNLLGNAIKFTEAGGVHLQVECLREDDTEVELRCTVTDTGIGIPQDKVADLFSAFNQADTTISSKFGGTGLGLSISKQLTELMGGRIGIDSVDGCGTKIWFTAVFGKSQAEPSGEFEVGDQLRGVNVLILSNCERTRELLERRLGSWGCLYECMNTVRSAAKLLDDAHRLDEPYDVIICDLKLDRGFQRALAKTRLDRASKFRIKTVILYPLGTRDLAGLTEGRPDTEVVSLPLKEHQLGERLCLLARETEDHKTAPAEPGAAGQESESEAQAEQVLLVEDSPTNCEVARFFLRKLGYQVTEAHDGQQALTALEKQTFDLVLMDLQMPVMSGFETTETIRSWANDDDPRESIRRHRRQASFVPIVAMTAHAMKEVQDRCLRIGMNGFIAKPVSVQSITAELENVRQGSSPALTKSAEAEAAPAEPARPTAPSQSSAAAIDWQDVTRRIGDDEEILATIVAVFVKEAPDRIESIRQALAEQDAPAVGKTAHALKGASANLGAKLLSKLALRIEMAGKVGKLERVPRLLDQVDEQYQHAVTELEARGLCPESVTV